MLLTVAEDCGGTLHPIIERATITRIGAGVDRTRRIADEAQARTLACLASFAAEVRAAGVEELAVVGTSALRDASGGEEFCTAAAEVLGVRPRVISGVEEARLTFAGALQGLSVTGEVLVVDVGGGSTEIVTGAINASQTQVGSTLSLDVGAVRLLERHVHHDPPLPVELARTRDDVRGRLTWLPIPASPRTLVGVAGTVTTLAAIAAKIECYDGALLHGAELDRAGIDDIVAELASLPLAARSRVAGLDPARADVIVTGGILVAEVIAWSRCQGLVVSDRGVRWGLLAAMQARPHAI